MSGVCAIGTLAGRQNVTRQKYSVRTGASFGPAMCV